MTHIKKASERPKDAKSVELSELDSLMSQLEEEMKNFLEIEKINSSLTGKERQRLISAGVVNSGFIDKTFDIARDNPSFVPQILAIEAIAHSGQRLEKLRQFMLAMQQFEQIAAGAFMLQADKSYRQALLIYNSLHAQAKARIPGAEELFRALMPFFRRSKKPGEGKLTERKLEKDFKNLASGKASGEIIIKNESPRIKGGIRKILDRAHKRKRSIEEEENGEG